MSDAIYPNREHENAVNSATRRALSALDAISENVDLIRGKLAAGTVDARYLQEQAGRMFEYLTTLETLRDVRDWHAADLADVLGLKPDLNLQPSERRADLQRRMHVDIQYFTESGTWNRPDRAIRTDYLLIAAGAGGSAPLSDSEPGRDGENGELRAGSFDPATVPEQLQVEIGRGGRGAQYGAFKAGDGADGYALFVTHLKPQEER
jgi:hypothetical protein